MRTIRGNEIEKVFIKISWQLELAEKLHNLIRLTCRARVLKLASHYIHASGKIFKAKRVSQSMVSESVFDSLMSLMPLFIMSLLFLGELIIVYKKNWYPDKCIRWTGLTLIIVVSSYLATLGSTINGTALTAVIGLLGTIAGYLVGTSQSEKTKGTMPPHAPGPSSPESTTPPTTTPSPCATTPGTPPLVTPTPSAKSSQDIADEAGMEVPKSK